ncbi:MAG: ABC transporter permease [Melioribacteraceae bacterium]|jgi:ABC-2 type transport system permease protein|nr:ABC transporter permease [Melioribacteraceae bacterium]
MKNIYTIALLTFREALSKKIFLFFFSVSTFVIIVFALLFGFISADSFSGGFVSSQPTSFDNSIANGIKMFLIYPLYAGGLFISIFSVAGFIPSLLEKGNIDLILSKPVSRAQVVLGKFFGGTAMVFINLFYAIFMLWVLIGLKFSVWEPDFLLSSISITLAFASIYSLIILIGILTKSSMFSLVVSYLIFFVFSPILSSRDSIFSFVDNDLMKTIFELLYYIIPQTSDLSSITTSFAVGNPIENPATILTSIVYIILILYSSIFIFSKKDY